MCKWILDQPAQDIQSASDMGNTKKVHSLLKTALGPNISKTAKLKSEDGDLIADNEKRLDGWVQHYSKLYSEEIPVKQGLKTVLPSLPELSELDLELAEEETLEAIDLLSMGKHLVKTLYRQRSWRTTNNGCCHIYTVFLFHAGQTGNITLDEEF